MNSRFLQKKCAPCEGGVPSLSRESVGEYLPQVPGWGSDPEGKKISREFTCKNFVEAMKFVNRVAEIAESENHHPDIHVHYNKVTLKLWTHAIGGLSENDFIVAAKVNEIKM